jgi:hypothetical protein
MGLAQLRGGTTAEQHRTFVKPQCMHLDYNMDAFDAVMYTEQFSWYEK